MPNNQSTDKPWLNQVDSNDCLRQYVKQLIETIKPLHGVWAKPIYKHDWDPIKAKSKPEVFAAKPESASDECFVLGFQSKGGVTPSLVQNVTRYAEELSKEPGNERITYRGSAKIGNAIVVYFDKKSIPKSTGLAGIAQQYKSTGRNGFIRDLIRAAQAAGVEDLLISHWPTETS